MKPAPVPSNRKRPRPSRPLSYRIPDAASITGISESQIRNLITTKRLAAVRIGRMVLIKADALERLVEDGAA